MKIVKDLYSCCLGLVGLHYLFSFVFLYTLLKSIGISDLSVISMDDITFTFASSSYLIITIALVGFLWIYIWSLLVNNENEVIAQLQNRINQYCDRINKHLPSSVLIIFTKKRVKFLLVCTIITLIIITLFSNNADLGFFWIILVVVFPLFYIYEKKKRDLILIAYISCIILFGVFFIKKTFVSVDQQPSQFHNISFMYNGTEISNTNQKNCCLIYAGYKYIILYDTVANKSHLYSTSSISKISY